MTLFALNKCSLLIFLLCFASYHCIFFDNNSIICFLGDSITQGGYFHNSIFQFYITRYPEIDLSFNNCGISGDTLTDLWQRLDEDVFVKNLTTAVIMFGMNDLGGYRFRSRGDPRNFDDIQAYNSSLYSLLKLINAKGMKIILQTPTIYDNTARMKSPLARHKNAVLYSATTIVKRFGESFGIPVVDYWQILTYINSILQAQNLSSTIIGPDRVHPGMPANFVMSYQFLKTLEGPSPVSHIVLARDLLLSVNQSINCVIHTIERTVDGLVKAEVTEGSLPFVVLKSQEPALLHVPFIRDFNTELLRVVDLPGDDWHFFRVVIDDVTIGNFTRLDLNDGINLAVMKHSPQYKQATEVQKALTEFQRLDQKTRQIKHTEYRLLKEYFANGTRSKKCEDVNITDIAEFINGSQSLSKPQQITLEAYLKNKPRESFLYERMNHLRAKARQLAIPKQRSFFISPA